jgi:ABC-2 type transport system permease protein
VTGPLRALAGALRAEWTKLRTVAGPAWLLAAAAAVTVGVSVAAVAVTRCPAGQACAVDPAKLSLSGVQFGQAVVAMLAVTAVSTEYSTGLIGPTLAATPRRWCVLTAKAVTVAGPVLVAAAAAVAGSLLAGRLLLPGHGVGPARGYPALSLADGAVLRAAAGSALYLVLVALLALGVAAAVRDTAVAAGGVLGLLYLFPLVASALGSERWQRRVERAGPMSAGLQIQATTGLRSLPISPWAGLGVLAAWAGAALVAGALALRLRDA